MCSCGGVLSGRQHSNPQAQESEVLDLIRLARSLKPRPIAYRKALDRLIDETMAELSAVARPIDRERISENFGRELRQLWLEASAVSTSSSYRSPAVADTTKTATGRRIDFGYERDLQPAHLEDRCKTFFASPPRGWTAEHILLSSGQSAMAAILHALEGSSLFDETRKLSCLHLGSYFETGEIFSLFKSLLVSCARGRSAAENVTAQDGDIVIVEPVFCDGSFGVVDVNRLLAGHEQRPRPRVYLFDNTLCGTRFALEQQLYRFDKIEPLAVFRIFSGLKLFQAGLELSSVGILSVFTRDGSSVSARELADRIRRIRTLLGLGLTFFEVAALEVPWFLDPEQTRTHERAVFDNNAVLAQAVAAENRLFDGVFHPSLLAGATLGAPYSAYRLREHDLAAYERLEHHIRHEAERRDFQFELGGSFGFRGHRFEVVRPETGEEPFLRVALGCRSGWSCDQIAKLMADISRATSVAELTADETLAG